MAENSKIEWTTHTFNPWIGCQKVGPGCDHCYAETWDARGMSGGPSRWGPRAQRTRTSPGNWRKPFGWDRAAAEGGRVDRVFCASLADVFDNHASILEEWRRDLWDMIAATPSLHWLLLTKRPGNIGNMLPVPFDFERQYPNVWLGCTITSREEMLRDAPKLKAVSAAVRFWSVEPLLADLGEIPADLMPDWIIVGGESGPHARPMHPAWARSIRDQCKAAGVPMLFKQWGEWLPFGQSGFTAWHAHASGKGNLRRPKGKWLGHAHFNDGAGGRNTHSFGPVETVMIDDRGTQAVRLGKARAGRLLDGAEHNGFPEVRHV